MSEFPDVMIKTLSAEMPCLKLVRNAGWKEYSSAGTGTAPFLLAEPADSAELRQLLQLTAQFRFPVKVLGAGTNMVGSDRTLNLLFLRLGRKGFSEMIRTPEQHLVCGAALRLSVLASAAADLGFGGLAPLCGIPGTLGGAVRMNAGANRSEISQFIRKIHGISLKDGGEWQWNSGDGGWAYRTSPVPGDVLVLSVELELPTAVPEEEHQRITEEKKRRVSVTPKGRSAGSTFRNPSGQIAGKLLESSGCKKIQCGTVRVSPDHANWIISEQAESPASEQDYLSVLLQMKQAVFREYEIELQTELCFADAESERLVKEKWKKN